MRTLIGDFDSGSGAGGDAEAATAFPFAAALPLSPRVEACSRRGWSAAPTNVPNRCLWSAFGGTNGTSVNNSTLLVLHQVADKVTRTHTCLKLFTNASVTGGCFSRTSQYALIAYHAPEYLLAQPRRSQRSRRQHFFNRPSHIDQSKDQSGL